MSIQYGRFKTFYLLSLVLFAGAMITGRIESSEGTTTVRHAHYSAARGTLPSEQGFRVVDSDPDHPPVVVEMETLRQGPTSTVGTQYWHTNSIPLDFGPAGPGVSAEWVLRVEESSYHRSPHFRTGWIVAILDKKLRCFLVFVGTDRVAIVNNDPDGQPSVAAFNAADQFHHYRIVVDDNQAMLFVDGGRNPIVSKPVGQPRPLKAYRNRVYFGDGTQLAGGKWQLKHFYYANDAASKSPFHPEGDP